MGCRDGRFRQRPGPNYAGSFCLNPELFLRSPNSRPCVPVGFAGVFNFLLRPAAVFQKFCQEAVASACALRRLAFSNSIAEPLS